MQENQETPLARLKDKLVWSLERYYSTWQRPIHVLQLIKPLASSFSRNKLYANDALEELAIEGRIAILVSPSNKRYAVPASARDNEEEHLDLIIALESRKK